MGKQLDINFNGFSDGTFNKVREAYTQEYINKLLARIDHLNHVVAGYKSIEAQRKKKQPNGRG